MSNAIESLPVRPNLASQLPANASGVDPLSFLLLSAALDDPQTGLVIFDTDFRLWHVTRQTPQILELKSALSMEAMSVLDLLSCSALERQSIELANSRIAEFSGSGPAEPVLLQNESGTRLIYMRLRVLADRYRAASFQLASQQLALPASSTPLHTNEFALRDSLTGLASRHYFEDLLTQVLTRTPAEPVTLFLIDLHRFKTVNDTLDHTAGDALLRLAAERLKSAVRKTDIIARLVGDQFAIMLHPAPGVDEAVATAHRVLDLVQRSYLIDGRHVNIGISIGIAQSPRDGSHCASLMRSANLALSHSKTLGRASYHFFEEHMERRAQAHPTNELELRRALALRQFELFYQPQVNITSGSLIGFEALLRWRHPERGMIPPGDFLPIAEEIGVIVPIGEWVVRTACREAMSWPAGIRVAVNASPLQFEVGHFGDSVKRALSDSGLNGERLEVEITEGIMLRNDEKVLKTLHDLRAMGVRIAMDDFGTGYASLSQLARFPFDKIKIDRSLAGIGGENPKQRSIVRAIIALGQSLGVSTLAEGVEDVSQLERLQSDGCSTVQGYLFGKPMPVSEIRSTLERFSATA